MLIVHMAYNATITTLTITVQYKLYSDTFIYTMQSKMNNTPMMK